MHRGRIPRGGDVRLLRLVGTQGSTPDSLILQRKQYQSVSLISASLSMERYNG
jgi:hypothetical protein